MKGENYKVRVQEPGTAYYMVFRNVLVEIKGEWLEVCNAATKQVEAIFNRKVVTYCQLASGPQAQQER